MDPRDDLDVCIDELHRLVKGTRPDQLTNPTPCSKWTVRELINHFVGGGHMFAGAFRGDEIALDPDAPMPDLVGDDHVASFESAIADFRSGVRSEGALDRMLTLPFATLPGAVAAQVFTFDLAVHCWDLARATGQQVTIPDEVITVGDAVAHQIISPEARNGDTFADEVAPPAGADPLTKLAAFTGRAV